MAASLRPMSWTEATVASELRAGQVGSREDVSVTGDDPMACIDCVEVENLKGVLTMYPCGDHEEFWRQAEPRFLTAEQVRNAMYKERERD
jgi:hypothetical protein